MTAAQVSNYIFRGYEVKKVDDAVHVMGMRPYGQSIIDRSEILSKMGNLSRYLVPNTRQINRKTWSDYGYVAGSKNVQIQNRIVRHTEINVRRSGNRRTIS